MDLLQVVQNLPYSVREALLKLLVLVLILMLVWLLRRAVAHLVIAPLKKVAANTKTEYDDLFLSSIERPLTLVIMAVAITLAAIFLNFDPGIQTLASNITRALIIAAVAFSAYNMIDLIAFTPITVRRLTGVVIEGRLLPFLRTAGKVFIVVMAVLIILQEFGYNASALIASFGIVGIGIGLAAQDAAANVFGFTAIVSDNPFNVGDYIEAGDFAAGTVEHVGVRSTRIRKLDQSIISVPNHRLAVAAVINWSRLSKRRLDFYLNLNNYNSSQQLRTLLDSIRDILKVRQTVEPDSIVVHLVNFNGRDVQIRVICYLMFKDWNSYTAETELIHLTIMDMMAGMGLIPGVTPAPAPAEPPVVTPRSDVPSQSNESASNQ